MERPRSTKAARAVNGALLFLLCLAALAAWRALVRVLRDRVALHVVQGGFLRVEIAVLVVAAALSAVALAGTFLDVRAGRRGARGRALRGLAALLVLGWLAFLAFAQPYQRLWLELSLGLLAGLWSALVLWLRQAGEASPRWLRAAELTLTALCVTAVLAELGLRAVAAAHPSPLLARVGDAPRELIARFRCEPGELRFGFACNERGYYDEPLLRRGEGEELVVSIGDSFNVGAVPHARHYTTVCERELGVPVHNLGVAGVGPPEYHAMLVDDALPLDPSVVVVSVFVGNDLAFAEVETERPDAALRSFLERERVLLWVLPRRLARVAEERERAGEAGRVQGERGGAASADELTARFPWLDDPRLEEATLSQEAWLELETERALDVCAGDPIAFDGCVRALEAMRAAAGEVPLVVMLVPDEFQVEDALWAAVEERAGVPLERDRPQRLLHAWLEAREIRHLDLLPVLRAVPPMPDGRRHLYHLRDTHFNARGNRAAGEALADFLAPLLR